MMLIVLVSALLDAKAAENYGEPDFQGHPQYSERALHLWVNAGRVAPEEWDALGFFANAVTPCSIGDFTSDEADPKAPLYYDPNLGAAARTHVDDMKDHGEVTSDSSDGTSMEDRVSALYSDTIVGEANAGGHVNDYGVVLKNWLCDPEARAVVMSGDATEVGTGQSDTYWTADVGGGNVTTKSPVTQATNYWLAGKPGETTFVMTDWQGDRTPDTFQVIVNGQPTDLELYWGTGHQGVWGAELDISDDDMNSCYEYYIYWELADESWGTYPESGSLAFGDRCSGERGFVDEQLGLNPPSERDDGKGCATTGGTPLTALAWLGGLLALRRRRQ